MSEMRVYVNAAFIPRHSVGGRPQERAFWRVGNALLTEDGLELSTKTERLVVPLASVSAVGAPPAAMMPPPLSFEQVLYLHHLDGGAQVGTALAIPRVTVRNFPLQLAAMLTGAVRVFVPRGTTHDAGYDECWLRFVLDAFRVQRAVGETRIPLDAISSLSVARASDNAGRPYLECVIHHIDGADVRSMTFLTYDRLPFLQQLLSAVAGLRKNASIVQAKGSADALSETAQQVAALLYTGGVTAGAIEQMLGLKPDDLDRVYEELLKLGLAEVVKVRKEIALTPAGAKVVDDIMKKQLTAVG